MKTWNMLWALLRRQSVRVPLWAVLLALFALIAVACTGAGTPGPSSPDGASPPQQVSGGP
jgi:putative exporter of polyketide antibiotics